MPYRSVNPATGEVLKTFTEYTDQEMMDALATADNVFVSWAAHPIEERAKMIARAAQLLLEQKNELARLAALEMGKCIAESHSEAELRAAILQYFADNAAMFLAPKPIKSAMGDAHLEFSPLGVLLSIQPWNYPYYQLSRFVGPHLISGNVMLLKHALGVPQCAVAFERILKQVGLRRDERRSGKHLGSVPIRLGDHLADPGPNLQRCDFRFPIRERVYSQHDQMAGEQRVPTDGFHYFRFQLRVRTLQHGWTKLDPLGKRLVDYPKLT